MTSFETVLDQFRRKRVLVVGDIMLDRFVYGTVSRISPEAPAPVLETTGPLDIVGGAGNVVRNIVSLGAACEIIAVVGRDDAAQSIRRHLRDIDVSTDGLIEVEGRVTTVKTRFVAYLHNTHLLRADTEETTPVSHQVEDATIAAMDRRIDAVDVVVLSDYAKGMLTPRVAAAVIAAAKRAHKPVIVDPKGLDYSRYRGATALTPNVGELAQALGRPVKNDETAVKAAANSLAEQIGCDSVLVTRGERGMLTVSRDGEMASFDATAKRVVDVSGAGDTVVASFALALVSDAGVRNAARLANVAAGVVVAKKGTSQVTANELRDLLLSRPHFELREKVKDLEAITDCVAAWRREGLTVGFTNGCFDLLHPGHVQLLCEARSYCDRLVVGLNNDASVKRLKGASRPVQAETARSIVLAGLAFVDAVVLFADDTPLELIGCIKPDVLLKGADYRIDQVVGRELVESYGGRVVLVELLPDSSTTRIIDRLKTNAANAASSLAEVK
ncbi:MAG TPA: D-glycero-beta-D-manno-heptose-7-phosphate kinase [Xanthobacteraceae bacterium]|nr:D-glycero-beta-D-manno-heptose-7-phosphate kinase [Xanthobacteraceae bacterium]